MDTNGLVSTKFNGNIEVCLSEQENSIFEVPFHKNQPAAAKINGLTLENEGFYRFKATLCGKIFYSNPTVCSCDETPIYWGDPHIHSVLSNCHADLCRPLFFAYIHGRYVSLLDWLAVAGHVSNGRCSDGTWNEQVAQSQLFNDPPEFATLPAYEASLKGGCGGGQPLPSTHYLKPMEQNINIV